jgi:sulfate adenylyltransferase subunit 1
VIRPKTEQYHDFRGFAGKVASGSLHVGEEIVSLHNGQRSKIKSIEKFEQQLPAAHAGDSVVITLEDEIDISRGNILATPDKVPEGRKDFIAQICWMDQQKLTPGKTYLLQHGANRIKAKVQQILGVTEVTTNRTEEKADMGLNDIGRISLKTAQPVFADPYAINPANGTFILVDEFSNATVAVGFID